MSPRSTDQVDDRQSLLLNNYCFLIRPHAMTIVKCLLALLPRPLLIVSIHYCTYYCRLSPVWREFWATAKKIRDLHAPIYSTVCRDANRTVAAGAAAEMGPCPFYNGISFARSVAFNEWPRKRGNVYTRQRSFCWIEVVVVVTG